MYVLSSLCTIEKNPDDKPSGSGGELFHNHAFSLPDCTVGTRFSLVQPAFQQARGLSPPVEESHLTPKAATNFLQYNFFQLDVKISR
jgi:hypothetical protein